MLDVHRPPRPALPAARPGATDALGELSALLEARWSCRGFLPDPVGRDLIEDVLTVAGRTPSWCNTQPWTVHVVSGEAALALSSALLRDAPEEMAPDFPYPAAYTDERRDRRRECGWQLYEAMGVAHGDREASATQGLRNFEFFGAPHVAIISTHEELGPYGAVDCGLFVQTFLLAAHAVGLGACPQAALARRAPVVSQFLDLPAAQKLVCGISFGWPDPEHPSASYRTSRADLIDFATFVDQPQSA